MSSNNGLAFLFFDVVIYSLFTIFGMLCAHSFEALIRYTVLVSSTRILSVLHMRLLFCNCSPAFDWYPDIIRRSSTYALLLIKVKKWICFKIIPQENLDVISMLILLHKVPIILGIFQFQHEQCIWKGYFLEVKASV